jgi:hypothetical protein
MKTGTTPIKLSFKATLFAQVSVANNKVVLGSLGVLPENVPTAGQIYLQILAEIVYKQVTKLLAGYDIPTSIDVKGYDFTAPVATVTAGHLVAASNLTSTGTPNISGVTWPSQKFAILASRNLMSAILDKYKTGLIKKMNSAKVDYSDSNWAGSYSIDGGISKASISLSSAFPKVDVEVTVNAKVEVGVSWWLVPAACAMESASNLL